MSDLGPNDATWSRRGLIEDVLARAVDDWLGIADFVEVARRAAAGNDEAVRLVALGLMTHALIEGLVVAGDVDGDGFHRWPTDGYDGVLQRIVAAWHDAAELYPAPGAVWFDLTDAGQEAGDAVLRREADEGASGHT